MELPIENKKRIFQALFVLLIILSVYFAVKIIYQVKATGMLGQSSTPATISFSGHGEVTAVPDIANVYFTISRDAKTSKEAQDAVAVVEKKVLDFLKTTSVVEKDIQTTSASSSPKYEYRQALCPQAPMIDGSVSSPAYYCGGGKQVAVGYTASESITLKIRKTDDVGAIMQGLAAVGVTDVSGPNFAIDKEDILKAEARKKAIDDAETKAKALARDLGVHLGKISSFSESGGGYPMYYAKDSMATGMVAPQAAPAELPKGENTISSDVTITYEIR